MNKLKLKRDRRRYRIHYELRKKGFNVDAYKHTIYIHFSKIDEMHDAHAIELMDNFAYSLQSFID